MNQPVDSSKKDSATVITRKRTAPYATYIETDEGRPVGIYCLNCRKEVRTSYGWTNVYMTASVTCWECGEELVREDRR